MHLEIIKITYNRTATHLMDDSFMNLGEEVILTLLWQSDTSESATVCFVISSNICYWLFKCGALCACVCVCVCVCACVCVCVRGGSHHSGVYSASEVVLTAACVQTHISIITVSVTWLCSTLGIELTVNLTLKLKLAIVEKGVTFLTRACGVRPITMHCVSWPIREDCACQKEGFVENDERGGA